jgi:uncharacterized protein (TIGR00251 family)
MSRAERDVRRPIERTSDGVRLRVRVQPRASRTEVVGVHGEAIRIRLSAPPVAGAANEALLTFLADKLSVPRTAIRLILGESSRSKVVMISGVDLQEASLRLDL